MNNAARTMARDQSGKVIMRFSSVFPGGSFLTRVSAGPCLMDCIFSDLDQTFYVLDLMAWNGQSFYDCDAEFRLFWLSSQIAPLELTRVTEQNQYRFVPLMVCMAYIVVCM